MRRPPVEWERDEFGYLVHKNSSSPAPFDFWADRLGLTCGCYNREIAYQIYNVAQMLIECDQSPCVDTIANKLGISMTHAELINYILVSVVMPDGTERGVEPFSYGTSPRCLLVVDQEAADQFLFEFEDYITSKLY